MYQITKQRQYTLRVDLLDWDETTRHAEYSLFYIGDEESKYRLTYFGYSGDASDSLGDNHRGRPFSTMDHDNDAYRGNCAIEYQSGWWHKECYNANLNGPYRTYPDVTGSWIGIQWRYWKEQYSFESSMMRIKTTFSDEVLSP